VDYAAAEILVSTNKKVVGRELNLSLSEIVQPEDDCMPGETCSHLR
jgi:hypothetical protein